MARRLRPPWSWREVAAWIDTEGSPILAFRKKAPKLLPRVSIAQKDRRPLNEIKDFLGSKGIKSTIVRFKPKPDKPHEHQLRVEGRGNVFKLWHHTN